MSITVLAGSEQSATFCFDVGTVIFNDDVVEDIENFEVTISAVSIPVNVSVNSTVEVCINNTDGEHIQQYTVCLT